MIIPKPGQSLLRPGAGNRTVLPFARAKGGGVKQTRALDERGFQPPQRRAARNRVDMVAQVLDLEAREEEFLQRALEDPDGDPSTLGGRVLGGFDTRAQALFGDLADPAERATAFRKLGPARRRLEQRALVLQQDAEDSAVANAIFGPAQTILTSPDRDTARTGALLDRLADVIETSALPRDRKDQVSTAITARAMAEGREKLLGQKFARFKEPARQLLEDGETEVGSAGQSAQADVPPDDAGGGASTIAVPVPRPSATGLGRLAPLVLAPLAPAVGTALLAAGLLSFSSTPAGIPEIRRRVALDGGGAVDLFLGDTSGSLTMTGPAGDVVRLDISRGERNRIAIDGGSVTAAGGANRRMSRDELRTAFDTLSGQARAIGLDIEIGGDDEQEGAGSGQSVNNEAETSVPPADRAGSQGTSNPDPEDDGDDGENEPAVLLHEGKQGKHIRGHNNFSEGRSELTHASPQSLLDRFAGRGQPVNKTPRGQPDFRERVDFGETIGVYVDLETGAVMPTTKGIIRYGADGRAHIVPARP